MGTLVTHLIRYCPTHLYKPKTGIEPARFDLASQPSTNDELRHFRLLKDTLPYYPPYCQSFLSDLLLFS